MKYQTHIATTLTISLPIMVATNTVDVGALLAVSLGTLFPDVDEPHSWIGKRTRGISDMLHMVFGHRGITHSLIGLCGISLIMALLTNIFEFNMVVALYFVMGYLLHLIEDSFSKSGVAWLQPFMNRKFKTGLGIIYYTTGGLAEKLVLVAVTALLLWELWICQFGKLILR